MGVGNIKSDMCLLIHQKTSLTWIVTIKYNQSLCSTSNSVCDFSTSIEIQSNIDSIVKQFGELEELPNELTKNYSEEKQHCEDKPKNSIRRTEGHFAENLAKCFMS